MPLTDYLEFRMIREEIININIYNSLTSFLKLLNLYAFVKTHVLVRGRIIQKSMRCIYVIYEADLRQLARSKLLNP